ncbi:MAG TPA: protein BatD [Firmicutes bacterium]|nr:protein BatD [Bacillota bacterium]
MTRKKSAHPLASLVLSSRITVFLLVLLTLFLLMVACPSTRRRIFPPPLCLTENEEIKARFIMLNPPPYYIGDKIRIRLEVESRAETTPHLPGLSLPEGNVLEVLSTEKPGKQRLRGGEKKYVDFTLVGWEVGVFSLPATRIEYTKAGTGQDPVRQVLTIPGPKLEISSVLPENKTRAELLALPIQPAKDPVSLPGDYLLLSKVITFFLIFILFCLLWLIYRRKKKSTAHASAELPPATEAAHLIALRRLEEIKEGNYLGKRQFKLYYSELTECLREYFERRFSIKAREMTTEEFLCALHRWRDCGSLEEKHRKSLADLLASADLVKFAQYYPSVSQAESAWELAWNIIIETKEEKEEEETAQARVTGAQADQGSDKHDLS